MKKVIFDKKAELTLTYDLKKDNIGKKFINSDSLVEGVDGKYNCILDDTTIYEIEGISKDGNFLLFCDQDKEKYNWSLNGALQFFIDGEWLFIDKLEEIIQ